MDGSCILKHEILDKHKSTSLKSDTAYMVSWYVMKMVSMDRLPRQRELSISKDEARQITITSYTDVYAHALSHTLTRHNAHPHAHCIPRQDQRGG